MTMALAEIHAQQKQLLDGIFRDYHEAPFTVWTPIWKWSSKPGVEPAFTLLSKDSQAVEALLHNPNEISLGHSSAVRSRSKVTFSAHSQWSSTSSQNL
jgi:hypothetical protein